MVMLKMERVKYNGRAPPGRLEEIMRQHTTRIMKMDRNNRTVLMRALYADFCANREAGLPYGNLAALITKLHETRPGKLPLHRCGGCSLDQALQSKTAAVAVWLNCKSESLEARTLRPGLRYVGGA